MGICNLEFRLKSPNFIDHCHKVEVEYGECCAVVL